MARTPLLRTLQKLMHHHLTARTSASKPQAHPQHTLTRRDFLAGTGALALSAALPRAAHASKNNPRIAIVGSGIAGLTCALTLADRGIRSTIYEASGRVGGRMFSNTQYWDDDQTSEWCGELIDTGHKTIRRLAHRFDLKFDNTLNAQPDGSTDTYYLSGKYYSAAQAVADFAPVFEAVTADLDAAGYPTTFDAYTPEGKALDEMSVYDWIESRVPGGHASPFGQMLDLAYATEYGADTTDQSALNLVYLLAYQPDPNGFAAFGESDEKFHIRGGNEQLPRAIARHLGKHCFKMGMRLTNIAHHTDGKYHLAFEAANGNAEHVTADFVVLALPFSVLREIDYASAGFDMRKQQAIQELGRGRSGKTQLQFDTRLRNRPGPWGIGNGSSYSDSGYQSTWEVTRAQDGNSGILNFFSGGSVTATMRDIGSFATAKNTNARSAAFDAIGAAELVFPGIGAHWNGKATQSLPHLHPLIRASYAYYRVGQYTAFGGYEGVRQDGVLFCGDHTSQDFQGYMEGGASEGRRAGRELAKLLRRT